MGSSDFSSFMAQPFIGPVLSMMCFLGLLFIAVMVLLFYFRRRKAAQLQLQTDPVTFDASGHDMPDLNLLVESRTPSPVAASSVSPAAPPRTARKGTSMVAVNDGDATEAAEVMTILRDVVDGRLLVQMGEKTLLNVNNDAEFKERFMRIMRELGQVATKPPTAPAPTAPEESPPDVEEPPVSLASLVPPPAPPSKPKAPPPPPPTPGGKMPGDLPSYRLEDNPIPERKRGQKMEMKPIPEVNIAGAIEAYLQYKIQNSEYAGRSIHIYPAPDGGVSIEVDGRFYDAVGDIGDDSVREFIATAIQEWQERH